MEEKPEIERAAAKIERATAVKVTPTKAKAEITKPSRLRVLTLRKRTATPNPTDDPEKGNCIIIYC